MPSLSLAACSLGNFIFNIIWAFLLGVATALDTLASQAAGAGDTVALRRCGVAAAAVMLVLCLPACAVLQQSAWVLERCFGQSKRLSQMAQRYCRGLLPGIPPLALFTVAQRLQLAQGRALPSILTLLAANLLNCGTNLLFIWRLGLGFDGSPLGTSVVRAAALLLLLLSELLLSDRRIDHGRSGRGGGWLCPWPGPGPPCRGPCPCGSLSSGVGPVLDLVRLGLPGGVSLGVEAWAFEALAVLASLLGKVSLDACAILLSLCSLAFTALPFGVAVAASIHVGNLLGAQQPRRAQATAGAALRLGVAAMLAASAALLLLRPRLASLFTADTAVAARVAAVAPVVALLQVVDGYQAVAAGVLRGLGRQPAVAAVNVLSFWLIGVPLGAGATFGAQGGIGGLWAGLTVGLAAGCACYAWMLRRVEWPDEARKALRRSTRLGTKGGADAACGLAEPLRHDWSGTSAASSSSSNQTQHTQAGIRSSDFERVAFTGCGP